jgi:hypothetical protein
MYNKMTQITIDFSKDENKNIEIFKAQNDLKNKADAVKKIIREYFNIK